MLKVTKRSGRKVQVNYHKITQRISKLAAEEPALDNEFVDPSKVAQKVIGGLYDGVTTSEIDNLAAETAGSMTINHPDYGKLASRILISNLHKNTPETFVEAMDVLFNNINETTGEDAPLVSDELIGLAYKFENRINFLLGDCDQDYIYGYFGVRTLIKSYLMKSAGKTIERPQYMLMRVSLGIWKDNWEMVEKTYKLMSEKYYTHATPTLFNSGTNKSQLSSCFLISNKEDSLDGIMDTAKDVAKISALAGGIGIHIHDVRARGSYIKGSGGVSNGLMPLYKTYNELARWWDQGGGKRKGSFAMYLEPWHADINEHLELRKNHGKEEQRARDLFTALWIPDLFMERVQTDGQWTLMCPNECPGLSDVYGDEFKELYEKYEEEGRGRKTIKAQDLWDQILTAQIETGTPYMLYKDACNEKSNQKNLGTIKSSNLCTEIIEYSDPEEYAVCNLASIAVNMFVENVVDDIGEGMRRTYIKYDFDKLWDITYHATKSLDQVIDVNYYPVPETRNSNLKHRPIGLGIQGLADTFAMMKIAFDSPEAKKMNDDIFETIYNAALTASMDIASDKGIYSSFKGSPASKGILQYDMWNKTEEVESKDRYDWGELKELIKHNGLRNSLLMAPMPTASTAQILGNNEAFEPFNSNLYTRRVLSGDYIVINEHLVRDLISRDLWDESRARSLMASNGSVQSIPNIPVELKERYKTAFEMSQKVILEMAADRGKYVCQSQSMNVFMDGLTKSKLTSMHFYGWNLGLKTGMYYLRTKAATDAIKFTVDSDSSKGKDFTPTPEEIQSCSIENGPDCDMCSG
jgi:ribonucleoside-diphosphate reductase alpha chain